MSSPEMALWEFRGLTPYVGATLVVALVLAGTRPVPIRSPREIPMTRPEIGSQVTRPVANRPAIPSPLQPHSQNTAAPPHPSVRSPRLLYVAGLLARDDDARGRD